MYVVLTLNGFVMALGGAAMALVALLFRDTAGEFLLAAALSLAAGAMLAIAAQTRARQLKMRHVFALTGSAWITAAAVGALPLWFWELSLTDAVFEAMSGITTTGSTVMSGLDATPRGILFWRALLQWFGGVGIIVTAMALLPILAVGGMQLFRTESSESGERELRSAASFAAATLWIYVVLTVICALAYMALGMGAFDAVAHAMTTLSTGGFSTYDASMGAFGSPAIEWTAILFMLAGSLPFVWYIRVITRRRFRSEQVAAFLPGLAVAILVLALWRSQSAGLPFLETLRLTAFAVVSTVTTTGYGLADYTSWGGFAVIAFFLMTAVGGCTGSTSGGAKVMRWIVTAKALRRHMLRLRHPSGVFPIRYEGRLLEPSVLDGVIGFFSLFFLSWVLMSLLLGFLGLDMLTAVSGAMTALMNVGPGIGPVIGPAGNFGPLPDAAKWVLAFGMYLGRLEIMTVLVMLVPAFWRD